MPRFLVGCELSALLLNYRGKWQRGEVGVALPVHWEHANTRRTYGICWYTRTVDTRSVQVQVHHTKIL